MTTLTIWNETDPTTPTVETGDTDRIADELAAVGIRFERWATVEVAADADGDAVLAAYREPVERLTGEGGFALVDVAQLHPSDDPEHAAKAAGARTKFLEEHTHAEDEVRFFVAGSGVFYLHLDGRVLAVLCTAGDLLGVPALTRHWFDMGTDPDFTALRFFLEEDGWVGTFTGDPLAGGFADFDALAARVSVIA